MPLLSIIIPVYNVEDYLEECLDSILSQDFYDYEVILVDDVSTDGSGDICNKYVEKHSNFKVIHLNSKGLPSGARNIGLQNASGEYVHFCDSDDYYLNNGFVFDIKSIKDKSPDLLIGDFICRPEKGAFYCDSLKLKDNYYKIKDKYTLLQYFLSLANVPWSVCVFIVKREFLIRNSIFFLENCYFEDAEWFTKILCLNESFLLLKEPFYCYRPRANGSITAIKTFLYSKSHLLLTLSLLRLLNKKKYRNIERNFVISRVKLLLGLFSTRCDTLNKNEIRELVKIIDENIEYFNLLRETSKKGDLFDFVNNYGSYLGLCLYRNYVIEKTLEKVYGKEDKDIYIFPTGYNGEGTARILKKAGYRVKGFLDNSDTKNGCIIDSIEVSLPAIIKNLNNEQLNNIFIIISTQKKQVVQILKNQLREFNIKDEQMVVRIY